MPLEDGPREPGPFPVDDLLSHLGAWRALQSVSDAAAGRARTRELLAQSASVGTWEGLLVDIAEGSAPIVATAGAFEVSGKLVGVAKDFVTVEANNGRPALLRIEALTSIRQVARGAQDRRIARSAQGRPAGSRTATPEVSFATVLDLLCSERAPVAITTSSSTIRGVLDSVGEDVITVRGSILGPTTHIRLGAVIACEIC